MSFTVREKRKCVERELRFRYRVYERRVDAGQMTRAAADREIHLMEEIAADYRAADEANAPQLELDNPPPPGRDHYHGGLRIVKE